ncbi:MAG TPA: hypothetical protein VGJ37_16605 [Pyrinomonadaceae bacterium]
MPWDVRRLTALLAEQQILKLRPDDLAAFDAIFVALNLKQPGLDQAISPAVLKEGYATTELRGFVVEFQRRLARLNRVHRRMHGSSIDAVAARDLVAVSRRDCKLALARYLFSAEEVVDRVLKEVRVSEGVKDIDLAQPRYVDTELSHALSVLPDFEARILKRLCDGSKIYWVSDATTSKINSLVEYPLTTVVLVIKPPGSHFEFEFKRAGRRGGNPLGVVFRRNENRVSPSHRLDGGSMQWLLRYETVNGSRLSFMYRLVHGTDAPLAAYAARNTVFAVPAPGNPPAFRYFTDSHVFGNAGFREMRLAMKDSVEALQNEEGEFLPKVPGDMALTAEFLSHVAPSQAIVCGTSSFRLDKLATYLSADGAETYFKRWLQVDYTDDDAKQFADELLDEVLGVYDSPDVRYEDYESYLQTAFAVRENRQRADQIFLNLVKEIATLWGTLLGLRGHSRGESFVARNVGLRTVWEAGEWRVKLIFMDHDGLSLPELEHGHFFAQNALPGILLDERHVWGRANPELFSGTLVGCLQSIYRTSARLEKQAQAVAESELKAAYKKTQRTLESNRTLRAFFSDTFLGRLFDWDDFVSGYLSGRGKRWQSEMKQLFAKKGYEPDTFDTYAQAVDKHKGFFERNGFLFER